MGYNTVEPRLGGIARDQRKMLHKRGFRIPRIFLPLKMHIIETEVYQIG